MKSILKAIKYLLRASVAAVMTLMATVILYESFYSDVNNFYSDPDYHAYLDPSVGHLYESYDEKMCKENIFDGSVLYFYYYHRVKRDCLRKRIETHKRNYNDGNFMSN